jgi:hypothetical protein
MLTKIYTSPAWWVYLGVLALVFGLVVGSQGILIQSTVCFGVSAILARLESHGS